MLFAVLRSQVLLIAFAGILHLGPVYGFTRYSALELNQVYDLASNSDYAAAVELSRRYLIGIEIEPDSGSSIYWLDLALQAQHPDAQFMRAVMHLHGRVYQQSVVAYKHWLGIAASQGHALASMYLNSGQSPDFHEVLGTRTHQPIEPFKSSTVAARPLSVGQAIEASVKALKTYRAQGDDADQDVRAALVYLPAWMCDGYEHIVRTQPVNSSPVLFGLDKGEFVRVLRTKSDWMFVIRERPPWMAGWVRSRDLTNDITLFGIPLHGYTADLALLRLPLYGLRPLSGDLQSRLLTFNADGILLSSKFVTVEFHEPEHGPDGNELRLPFGLPLKSLRYTFGDSPTVRDKLVAMFSEKYGKSKSGCWSKGIGQVCMERFAGDLIFDYRITRAPYHYIPPILEAGDSR